MHFVVQYKDRPERAAQRAADQPAHIAYRKGLGSRIVLAGPLLDDGGARPVGSLIVIEAADLAEARRIALDDPHAKAGNFDLVAVTPFRVMAVNPPAG
jgi:uncharacterized protein YciI